MRGIKINRPRVYINREEKLDSPNYVKFINPEGYDDIEKYISAVRDNRREEAYYKSAKREKGAYVDINGNAKKKDGWGWSNCISTATDNYNDDYQAQNQREHTLSSKNLYNPVYAEEYEPKKKQKTGIWSNVYFKNNASKLGFKKIPAKNAKRGDILQHYASGIPIHATTFSSIDENGRYRTNYANGSYGEPQRHNSPHWQDPEYAYTYVGTPRENDFWQYQFMKSHAPKRKESDLDNIFKVNPTENMKLR